MIVSPTKVDTAVHPAERASWHLTALTALALLVLPALASAQVPPRFYWKSLMGSNAVPVIYQSLSGNANPFDASHLVSADVEFSADVLLAGYARLVPIFGRSGMVAVLQPTGRLSAESTINGLSAPQHAGGFGDPMFEVTINLVGPPPIQGMPDLMRYEPGFSLDLLVDLVVPVGEYDENEPLNLGQNRWYGRIGAPIVWQLGPWVPGRRTTLELLPSVWIYGDNDDFQGGTLETDPMVQVEAHLTRDFTSTFWGSLDVNWMSGAEATVADHTGESLDNFGVGFTLGYHLNESLQMTLGYMSTVSDSAPEDFGGDGFRISLVAGWHKLVEGIERLGGGE